MAFCFGVFLMLIAMWELIGLVGVGHNQNVMPQKALLAPSFSYLFPWPVLFPLSLSRNWLIRLSVVCVVIAQVFLAAVIFFGQDGLKGTRAQMGRDSSMADGVIMLLEIYGVVTFGLLFMSAIPLLGRRWKQRQKQVEPAA